MNWKDKVKSLKLLDVSELDAKLVIDKLEITRDKLDIICREFESVILLTCNEPDFPRKLLKFYNINLPEEDTELHLESGTVRSLMMKMELPLT